MSSKVIDLRSDTITRPTAGMRQAIANAEVGDDCIDIDPTMQRLQDALAERLGKEAAIFMPSGTMTNQVGVRVHCGPGDEFICEAECHILNYEQGAYAQLSGVAARAVQGDFGVIDPAQLVDLIRPENEHLVRTRLVCLENTHNRGGGHVQPYENVAEICNWAHENGLRTHLDGARLFNAAIASGIEAAQWAQHFDTVSICFSKGMGAPVGSALAGTKEMIALARRHRKLFGGAMRQAGIIAAGALYALENHVERLAEDHANAQILADAINSVDGLRTKPVQTNLVTFYVDRSLCTAQELVAALKDHGIRVLATTRELVRAVTHLDVTTEEVEQAAAIIPQVVEKITSGSYASAEQGATY